MTEVKTVVFEPIRFNSLEIPNGCLPAHPAAHALWWYYIMAQNRWAKIKETIKYEDEKDPSDNFKKLFINAAQIYGVDPDVMIKMWKYIKLEAARQNTLRVIRHTYHPSIGIKVGFFHDLPPGCYFDRVPEIKLNPKEKPN